MGVGHPTTYYNFVIVSPCFKINFKKMRNDIPSPWVPIIKELQEKIYNSRNFSTRISKHKVRIGEDRIANIPQTLAKENL